MLSPFTLRVSLGILLTKLKERSGAVDRDRTGDLVLTMDVLYQLSYNGLRGG